MSTESFKNKLAFKQNKKLNHIYEYPLFTDASYITGTIVNNNNFPYEILNPMVDFKQPVLLPRIVLRVFDYTNLADDVSEIVKKPINEKQSSNLSTFTSLGKHQEICALLSLIYGIRLKVGGCNRWFSAENETDRFGSILNTEVYLNPAPNRVTIGNPRIPHAIRYMTENINVPLNDAEQYLSHLMKVDKKKHYAAIIRATRIYSDALWFAENDPNHSWIMFVSAIESAAEQHWKGTYADDTELLKEEYPDLYNEIIKKLDEEIIKKIAKKLHLSPKKKFIEFIKHFHQPQTDPDIPLIGQVDWREFDAILNQIYKLRNCFLHSGQPFPPDMSSYPYLNLNNKKPSLTEKPIGGRTFYGPETVIEPKDQPLLLWKFEEIVRKSLLKWILTVK